MPYIDFRVILSFAFLGDERLIDYFYGKTGVYKTMKNIVLPPDIEAPLTEEARRQGTTTEQLVIDSLRKLFVPEPKAGKTLFDLLSPEIGAVSGTTDHLSENCGKRFSDILLSQLGRVKTPTLRWKF